MQSRLATIILAMLSALLLACSDGSDSRNDGGGGPGPGANLDETGIYSGTLVTDSGDVVLMSLQLARDGTTAITLETDDSERPSIVLWGTSDGQNGAVTFEGEDTDSGESVSTDIAFSGTVATGALQVADINGNYELDIESFSARSSSLQALSGRYARNDNLPGLSELTVNGDGSVQLSGACDGTGSVFTIDDQVNLYRLELDGGCSDLDVLVSLQDIEVEEDVISLAGGGSDGSFAFDFYRL